MMCDVSGTCPVQLQLGFPEDGQQSALPNELLFVLGDRSLKNLEYLLSSSGQSLADKLPEIIDRRHRFKLKTKTVPLKFHLGQLVRHA